MVNDMTMSKFRWKVWKDYWLCKVEKRLQRKQHILDGHWCFVMPSLKFSGLTDYCMYGNSRHQLPGARFPEVYSQADQ